MSDRLLRKQISIEPNLASVLTKLAKQQHKTVASLTRELLIEALELREDIALSELAEARDTGKQKTISHKNAWK